MCKEKMRCRNLGTERCFMIPLCKRTIATTWDKKKEPLIRAGKAST